MFKVCLTIYKKPLQYVMFVVEYSYWQKYNLKENKNADYIEKRRSKSWRSWRYS